MGGCLILCDVFAGDLSRMNPVFALKQQIWVPTTSVTLDKIKWEKKMDLTTVLTKKEKIKVTQMYIHAI